MKRNRPQLPKPLIGLRVAIIRDGQYRKLRFWLREYRWRDAARDLADSARYSDRSREFALDRFQVTQTETGQNLFLDESFDALRIELCWQDNGDDSWYGGQCDADKITDATMATLRTIQKRCGLVSFGSDPRVYLAGLLEFCKFKPVRALRDSTGDTFGWLVDSSFDLDKAIPPMATETANA